MERIGRMTSHIRTWTGTRFEMGEKEVEMYGLNYNVLSQEYSRSLRHVPVYSVAIIPTRNIKHFDY